MANETLREKQVRSMLARRLKEVRMAKGLGQEDLAKALDVTQGLVSQYESGTVPIVLSMVLDICDVLGCSLDYLLGREHQYTVTPIGRMTTAFSKLASDDQGLMITVMEATAAFRESE